MFAVWPLAHVEAVCTAIGWHHWMRPSRRCWRRSRMMTPLSHTPADDDEAFLDATVGLEPALIEAEPWPAAADRCVVDDDHKADWALRTLGQLETQQRQCAAFVAAEMERLQAWQAHEDRQAERFLAYLTTLLRPYDDQLKAEGK